MARVVQKLAAAVGLGSKGYSGQSLRTGLPTGDAMNGVGERRIAKQTHHRSLVVRACVRDGEVLLRGASGEIGLL